MAVSLAVSIAGVVLYIKFQTPRNKEITTPPITNSNTEEFKPAIPENDELKPAIPEIKEEKKIISPFENYINQSAFPADQYKCNGSYDIDKAKDYIQELNVSKKSKFITFNAEHKNLTGNLIGGTCTVKSIMQLTLFFRFLKEFNALNEDTPGVSRGAVYAIELKKYFGNVLKGTDKSMRAAQAALNTFEINTHNENVDLDLEKVKAILSLKFEGYDVPLRIDRANYISLKEAFNKENYDLVKKIAYLPVGVYLLRCIKPSNNDNGETHGHTLSLMVGRDPDTKEKIRLFFNPNRNSHVSSEKVHKEDAKVIAGADLIAEAIKTSMDIWDVPKLSIFPLLTPAPEEIK